MSESDGSDTRTLSQRVKDKLSSETYLNEEMKVRKMTREQLLEELGWELKQDQEISTIPLESKMGEEELRAQLEREAWFRSPAARKGPRR